MEGFIQQEILPLFLQEYGKEKVRLDFSEIEKPFTLQEQFQGVPPELLEHIDHEKLKEAGVVFNRGNWHIEVLKNSALVFDLAVKDEVIKTVATYSQNMKMIEVPHGLDIPVGIGFSLFMLPKLIEDHNWQNLWTLACNLLKAYNYDEILPKIGIEVDNLGEQGKAESHLERVPQ